MTHQLENETYEYPHGTLRAVPVKPSRLDGRVIAVSSVIAYFLILYFGSFFASYRTLWQHLGVPAESPSFADTRIITEGLDTYRRGIDPLLKVPGDAWNRTMNYPRIWLGLTWLGIGEKDTVWLGTALAFLFYASALKLMGRINATEGMLYSIFLCSPSVMLAVERGNNDLLVFGLLATAVLLQGRGRPYAYPLILFAAVLKLYPIFAITEALRETQRRAVAIGILVGAAFLAYVAFTWRDILQVSRDTPRPTIDGYGRLTLFGAADHWFQFRGYNFSRPIALSSYVVLAVVLAAAYVFARRRSYEESVQSINMDAFRIGASVYLFTFIIGNNWNYRLVLFLFVMPQLLVWIRQHSAFRKLSTLMLGGSLATVWMPWLLMHALRTRFLVDPVREAINWGLFLSLAYLILATLPAWMKDRIWLTSST